MFVWYVDTNLAKLSWQFMFSFRTKFRASFNKIENVLVDWWEQDKYKSFNEIMICKTLTLLWHLAHPDELDSGSGGEASHSEETRARLRNQRRPECRSRSRSPGRDKPRCCQSRARAGEVTMGRNHCNALLSWYNVADVTIYQIPAVTLTLIPI